MSLDPVLAAARDMLGRPRFYPPGSHPAAFQMREALRCAQAVGLDDRNENVRYLKRRLALFEELESVAKADYLRSVRGREGRRFPEQDQPQ